MDLDSLLMLTFLVVVSVKVVSHFYYENQKYELKYRREKHAPKP